VVEVDVRQQDVSHVGEGVAVRAETRIQRGETRARSAFDEDDRVAVPNQIGGDGVRLTLKV
jgi:hypothetical protein